MSLEEACSTREDVNDLEANKEEEEPKTSTLARDRDLFWLHHHLHMDQLDCIDAVPDNISFSLLEAFGLLFSIGSYLFDIITDITVATVHYLNHNYWYFSLTIAFVLLPTLVVTIISLRWYINDAKKDEGFAKVTKLEWTLRFVFLILQLGPIMRYIDSLVYGFKFRQDHSNPLITRQYYFIITDATMLRLFESFMEAAPQLVLQIYILYVGDTPNVGGKRFVAIQLVSIFTSLVSLSWSLVSYFRILRMSLPNKRNITWKGSFVMFLWKLCMIFSRVLAIALAFSSISSRYVGVLCFIHIVLMFVWIVSMRTKFCEHWFDEVLYNLVLAVIFLFCFFSPLDGPTRWRYAFYYCVSLIESTTLLVLWYVHLERTQWFHLTAFFAYYLLFVAGLFFMVLYYLQFHPNVCQQPSVVKENAKTMTPTAELDMVAINSSSSSPKKTNSLDADKTEECLVWTTKEFRHAQQGTQTLNEE